MSRRSSSRELVRCSRCGARTTANKTTGWNIETKGGRVVANLCPACQSPAEAEEAMRRVVGMEPTYTNGGYLEAPPEAVTRETVAYAMQRALHRARGLE